MNKPSLMELSNNELLEQLTNMTTAAFIKAANEIIKFYDDLTENLIAEDKALFETARQMVVEGKAETFEERKYFMDIMGKVGARIKSTKIKMTAAKFASITAVGGALGVIIWRAVSKQK